jgi:hypothetical protein
MHTQLTSGCEFRSKGKMKKRRNSTAGRVACEENVCSWVLLQAIFNLGGERSHQFHGGIKEAGMCVECDVAGL